MKKIYDVIAIDDKPETMEPVLRAVKARLKMTYDTEINYEIFSKQDDMDKLYERKCDIVMFDCALSGGGFSFGECSESQFGLELLKQYRQKNKRTKIIFYSGSFDFHDTETFRFSALELVEIINKLNVFAITNHDIPHLVTFIKKAIDELDTVMVSLEELISDYGENGFFYVDGERISSEDLLSDLKLGTLRGEIFRKEVYSTIVSYFMKFGEKKDK